MHFENPKHESLFRYLIKLFQLCLLCFFYTKMLEIETVFVPAFYYCCLYYTFRLLIGVFLIATFVFVIQKKQHFIHKITTFIFLIYFIAYFLVVFIHFLFYFALLNDRLNEEIRNQWFFVLGNFLLGGIVLKSDPIFIANTKKRIKLK